MTHVSFAAAVSGDLSQVVNSTIVEYICEQKAADRDRASVAIHGMREHGNDISDARELFEYIGCNVHVVSATRINIAQLHQPSILAYSKSHFRPSLIRVSDYRLPNF